MNYILTNAAYMMIILLALIGIFLIIAMVIEEER